MKLDITFQCVESPATEMFHRRLLEVLDRIATALEADVPQRAPATLIVRFGAPTPES